MPVATPQRHRMDADLPPLPPVSASSRQPRTVTFADEQPQDYAGEHRKVEKSMRRQARRERERAIEEREEQLERIEAQWDGYYAPPRSAGPSSSRNLPQHARTPHPSPMISSSPAPYSPSRLSTTRDYASIPGHDTPPRRTSVPPHDALSYRSGYTAPVNSASSNNDWSTGSLRPSRSTEAPQAYMQSQPNVQIPARPPPVPTSNNGIALQAHPPTDAAHGNLTAGRHRAGEVTADPRPGPIEDRQSLPRPSSGKVMGRRRVSEPVLSTVGQPQQYGFSPRLSPVVQSPEDAMASTSQHLRNIQQPELQPRYNKHQTPRLNESPAIGWSHVASKTDREGRNLAQSSSHAKQTILDQDDWVTHEEVGKIRPAKQRAVSTPVETVVQAVKDQSATGLHMTLDEMEEDVTCSICLQIIVAAHGMSPCGHTICGGCANEWIREKSTCPACRGELTKNTPFVPLLGMDAIISKWVRKQGENWEGLEDWKERCEMWQAHRAFNEQTSRPSRTPEIVSLSEEDDPYRNWLHQDFGNLSFEPHPRPSFSGSFVERHDRAMFDLLTGSRPSERVMREMLFPSSFAIEAMRDILHDQTRDRFRDRFRHAALRIHRHLS